MTEDSLNLGLHQLERLAIRQVCNRTLLGIILFDLPFYIGSLLNISISKFNRHSIMTKSYMHTNRMKFPKGQSLIDISHVPTQEFKECSFLT